MVGDDEEALRAAMIGPAHPPGRYSHQEIRCPHFRNATAVEALRQYLAHPCPHRPEPDPSCRDIREGFSLAVIESGISRSFRLPGRGTVPQRRHQPVQEQQGSVKALVRGSDRSFARASAPQVRD